MRCVAAIYALLATAYSLIYGLVGRSISAFGEIAVLGAYGRSAAVSGGGRSASATRSRLARTAPADAARSRAAGACWSAAWVEPLHARHRLGQPILIATARSRCRSANSSASPGLARTLVAAVVQPADRTGARRRFRSSR
jgi:branched-subunit amino acid ABC-type transport system permease component